MNSNYIYQALTYEEAVTSITKNDTARLQHKILKCDFTDIAWNTLGFVIWDENGDIFFHPVDYMGKHIFL